MLGAGECQVGACLGYGSEIVNSVRCAIASFQQMAQNSVRAKSLSHQVLFSFVVSVLSSVLSLVFNFLFVFFKWCFTEHLSRTEHFQTPAPLSVLCAKIMPLAPIPTPVTEKQ